ncbi:MAG: 3-oxoacyl-ACP synthase III [Pirellulaceae bacterium]|nr:3-oxoacyl-ACP synthase III [Pirellulaceae bacterium]
MHLQYENVCLEAVAHVLPDEVVTSEQIETRLASLYERLRLPEGRLELMSGIRERRFWPPGVLPGQMSVETGRRALEISGVDRREVGALVHGSVCRDYLEPATAAGVHHGLDLPAECILYDVSNACLGLLNGMIQVANMIELGQIRAGLVVGTESSRGLVEATIAQLNADESLTRKEIKPAFASLTIGSGSAAILLAHRDLSRRGRRLLGGVALAATDHCDLCRGGYNESDTAASAPLMDTDSELLMREGVAAARVAFERFCSHLGWQPSDINKTFCHQVGQVHRRLLLETLGLSPAIDFATLEWLGNTGSVALPMTASLGIESGHVQPGDRIALLGIGSGINVLMLGVEWR